MKSIRISLEHNCPVEKRCNTSHAILHFLVPKLQLPSVFLRPAFIQIYNEIESSLPISMVRVNRKIGMDIEVPATLYCVETTAFQFCVRYELLNTSNNSKKVYECGGVKFANHCLCCCSEMIGVINSQFLYI